MIKLVDIGLQHLDLKKELQFAIDKIINESIFIGGEPVKNFENSFAKFCQVSNAIGVSNGTSAIEIVLRANKVGSGDEVITVAHTFFATAEAIINVGAKPIFVDVSIQDGLMDLTKIRDLITPKTKAIIPVHLYGHLVNIEELNLIAKEYGLIIIEDAAQAHGASANWGMPGQFASAATYSFYPGKNLGAFGDAGAITTNDKSLAISCMKIRDHGRVSKYEHDLIGTNARLDSIQAAVLEVKLSRLAQWNVRRTIIAESYMADFKSNGFKVLANTNSYKSAWHLFVVRVRNRDQVQKIFSDNKIETGIHYPIPLHKQPALSEIFGDNELPVTEKLADEIISLPIHPYLTDNDVEKIINLFNNVAKVV